jgi:hypothetical protein
MNKMIVVATLFFATASQVFAGSATFYKDSSFRGKNFTAYSGKSVNSTSREYGMHDSISSLTVSEGTCVVLFKDKGFEGTKVFLSAGSYSSLKSYGNFNDKTSSLHVFDSETCSDEDLSTLYRDNYSGKNISVPIGYSTNKLSGSDLFLRDFNDDFTSVKVGYNACVVLYKHTNLTGTRIEVLYDTSSLGSTHNFNDEASSLAVRHFSECQ